MKVKVTKEFRDVHTGKIHAVGDEMKISEKRFKEITEKGEFVKEIKETKQTETKEIANIKPETASESERASE